MGNRRPLRSGRDDAMVIEQHFTDIGLDHPACDVEERALAAPAGTDNDDELAEIDALVQRHGDDWPLAWLTSKGIEHDQAA